MKPIALLLHACNESIKKVSNKCQKSTKSTTAEIDSVRACRRSMNPIALLLHARNESIKQVSNKCQKSTKSRTAATDSLTQRVSIEVSSLV